MRRKWEGEEEWGENEKEQQHSQTRMEKSGRRKWRLRASYEDHGMGDEGAPKEACRKQANYMGEGREKSATEKRGASFSSMTRVGKLLLFLLVSPPMSDKLLFATLPPPLDALLMGS